MDMKMIPSHIKVITLFSFITVYIHYSRSQEIGDEVIDNEI